MRNLKWEARERHWNRTPNNLYMNGHNAMNVPEPSTYFYTKIASTQYSAHRMQFHFCVHFAFSCFSHATAHTAYHAPLPIAVVHCSVITKYMLMDFLSVHKRIFTIFISIFATYAISEKYWMKLETTSIATNTVFGCRLIISYASPRLSNFSW